MSSVAALSAGVISEAGQSDCAVAEMPRRRGWYAVRTRSNCEKRVLGDLVARGVSSYLPVIRERHQWKDRTKTVELPLFPGYLFTQLSETVRERLDVLKTSGVVCILGIGAVPERLPDSQMEAVRRMEGSNLPLTVHPLAKQGSLVRVRRGPLQGVTGVLLKIKNQHRLIVSIDLLSQSVSAEVDVRDVDAVT